MEKWPSAFSLNGCKLLVRVSQMVLVFGYFYDLCFIDFYQGFAMSKPVLEVHYPFSYITVDFFIVLLF